MSKETDNILTIENLKTYFQVGKVKGKTVHVRAVDGVSLAIKGELWAWWEGIRFWQEHPGLYGHGHVSAYGR